MNKISLKPNFYSPPALRTNDKNQVLSFGCRLNRDDEYSFQRIKPAFHNISPQDALKWDFDTSINKLEELVGQDNVSKLMAGESIDSPVAHLKNSEWIKQNKIVGINPRITGTYWNIIKYAMTFPEESIHLFPLFEPGCAGSLYAPLSWQLNSEFLDPELVKRGFNTPEKQLKLVVNTLHALSKTVGMDVLQHTDRYSELVFANPGYFEWIKLNEDKSKQLFYPDVIYDEVSKGVEGTIINFLKENGDVHGNSIDSEILNNFFSDSFPEDKRLEILFGQQPNNYDSKDSAQIIQALRTDRRIKLINYVRNNGYETSPTAIGYPYRPLVFDKMETDGINNWATFKKTDSQDNRFFGSLTSFKWYSINDDNSSNFGKPNKPVWEYLGEKLAKFQKDYNFDFLRTDMGYIKFGYPEGGVYSDFHSFIKDYIKERNNANYLASFGEAFYHTDDCGGEIFNKDNTIDFQKENDIDNKKYDVAIGNIHCQEIDDHFLNKVKIRNCLLKPFKLALTMMSADYDTPKYNYLYMSSLANGVRAFLGLFLNQPSYMGMGFELKDPNLDINEHCTEHYININPDLPPYKWGENHKFHSMFTKMRHIYSSIGNTLKRQSHFWLNADATGVGAWTYYDEKRKFPSYLFVINTDLNHSKNEVQIDNPLDIIPNRFSNELTLRPLFSTSSDLKSLESVITRNNQKIKLTNLAPGEGRVYKLINKI